MSGNRQYLLYGRSLLFACDADKLFLDCDNNSEAITSAIKGTCLSIEHV